MLSKLFLRKLYLSFWAHGRTEGFTSLDPSLKEQKQSKNTIDIDELVGLHEPHDEQYARNFNTQTSLSILRLEMAKWPERDQDIFRLRFEQDLALDVIGRKLGIGKSYVLQIIKRRCKELKDLFN